MEFNLLVETLSKLRREGCKKLYDSISQARLQGIQFIKTIQNLFHEIISSNGQNMMNLHSGCALADWKALHITMKSFSLEMCLIGIWPAPLTMIFSNWQNMANLHWGCADWKVGCFKKHKVSQTMFLFWYVLWLKHLRPLPKIWTIWTIWTLSVKGFPYFSGLLEMCLIRIWLAPLTMILSNWQNMANLH